ncbi:MAG: hypothetical protein V4480_01025 [Patescibacteria group bacterium]
MKSYTNKQKIIAGFVLALIVVAGVSFAGGMTYAKNRTPMGMRAAGGFAMAGGQGGTRTGQAYGAGARGQGGALSGGAAIGEVLAKDDKSITVKLPNGGSRIAFFTGNTPVTKSAPGNISDVTVGQQVQITGAPNADGSISAQAIRVGGMPPMMTPSGTNAPTAPPAR